MECHTSSSKTKKCRSVLTLSSEQLKRKRDHDREAQRANRARIKNQIERLETEIRELKDTQREKLIRELQSQNEALQEEVRRLQSFQAMKPDSWTHQSVCNHLSAGSGAMPDYNQYLLFQITNKPNSWNSAPTSVVNNVVSLGVPSLSPSVSTDIQPSLPTLY